MPPLEPLLSNAEVIEYVRGLETQGRLEPGTDDYWVYASLFQLSPTTFTRAMTALKKGIITTTSIRGLSGVTDQWVEWLIEREQSDQASVAQKRLATAYINEHFPVYVDADALYNKVRFNTKPLSGGTTLGEHEEKHILEAESFDPADLLVSPRYDLSRTDPNLVHSFREAVEIYFLGINRNQYLLDRIEGLKEMINEDRDKFINASIYEQTLDLADGIRSKTLFLRTPTTSLHTFRTSFLAWVATRKYRVGRRSVIKKAIADFLRLAASRDRTIATSLHADLQESPATPGTKTYYVAADPAATPPHQGFDLFTHADFTKYSTENFRLVPGTMEQEWTRFRALQYGLQYGFEPLYPYLTSSTERARRNIQAKISATINLLDQTSDTLAICQEAVSAEMGRNKYLRGKEGGNPMGLLLAITYAR